MKITFMCITAGKGINNDGEYYFAKMGVVVDRNQMFSGDMEIESKNPLNLKAGKKYDIVITESSNLIGLNELGKKGMN